MNIVGSAVRTIKRSEISAEFFSFPQKYIVGTDPEMETLDKWKSAMSSMLQIDENEDGRYIWTIRPTEYGASLVSVENVCFTLCRRMWFNFG